MSVWKNGHHFKITASSVKERCAPPSAGQVTHIREAKEQRYAPVKKGEKRRKVPYLPSPHRLRDTFATACLEARVGGLETKVLMNHTLPAADDVTEGYMRPSVEHLRCCVGAVTTFLLERTRPAE